MGVKIKQKGDWKKTELFLKNVKKFDPIPILKRYGEIGVAELQSATPTDTGLTAASWYYEIEKTKDGYILNWSNANVVDGLNIALLIQYGHGTRNGVYVQGRDYINPALRDIFDTISLQLWREVSD